MHVIYNRKSARLGCWYKKIIFILDLLYVPPVRTWTSAALLPLHWGDIQAAYFIAQVFKMNLPFSSLEEIWSSCLTDPTEH